MRHLKKIDMFGTPLTFNLNQSSKYHQSRFGGISTFVVYSLALIYAIMNLRSWGVGELLPTITTQRSAILDQRVPLLSQLQVKLSLASYSSRQLPQLASQWFTVLYGNNNTVAPFDANSSSYTFVMDFTIDQTQTDINTQSQFTILSCNPARVTVGKCANSTSVATFLSNQAYYFSMEFNLTYINPNTFEVTVVKQIAYISLEQGQAHFSTINLGATLYQMRKPAIIQSDEYYYGFTTQKQYIETFKESYGRSAFGSPIVGNFYIYSFFSVDFVADLVLIQYPSIFVILGNIGAIGGMLLYFKHVIEFHNSRQAENLLLDTVIKMLYPKYEEVKVETRFNKIKQVTFHDKTIDIEKYKKFQEKMKTKILDQFTLPQLIMNQIQLQHFIKELHPNYEYAGEEFDWLIKSQEELESQKEMDYKIDLTSRQQQEMDNKIEFTSRQQLDIDNKIDYTSRCIFEEPQSQAIK